MSRRHPRRHVGPAGAGSVGFGLVLLAVASLGYLTVAGRSLGPELFGPLAVFWIVLHTLGPGMFLPLEQELARALASRRNRSLGSRAVVRQVAILTLLVSVAAGLVLATAQDRITTELFRGSTGLFAATLIGLFVMAGSYLARGLFAGTGAWRRYGVQLGTDGALRLAAVVLLAALGTDAAWPYAMGLVLAVGLSTLLTAGRPALALEAGDPVAWSLLTGSLGWLLAASFTGLLLVNAGPLAVHLLANSAERAATGNFVAALVLARLPLLLFAAIQATLLPALARQAEDADRISFLRSLRQLVVAVSAMGLVAVAAGALAGPALLRLLFGDAFRNERLDLILLVLCTVGFMLMTVFGQALIALQRYPAAAAGPMLGLAAFVTGCAVVPEPLTRRVALALTVAVALALATLVCLLQRHIRSWSGARVG